MLETIRQYAHEKLWQAGEGELLSRQHLAYFVDLAERAEPNLRAFAMIMWLDWLETDLDNIRTAINYALESDIEAQLRLASALLWFWHIRGHRNEGLDLLERGLAIEAAERGDQELTPSRVIVRGKALNVAGFLALMLMKLDKGVMLSEESRTLFQGLGTIGKQGMAYALWNLAAMADQQDRSKALCQEALALFQQIGDKFGIAQCLDGLGDYASNENDYEQARSLGEQHLALRHEIGDKDGQALAFLHLGQLAFQQGNFKGAIIHHEASLVLFREVGNRWAMGWVLSKLGRVALAQGNYGQATIMLERALALDQDLGDKFEIARMLNELGSVARSQGDYESATRLHTEALILFREEDSKFLIAYALRNLGLTALAQSHYEQAVKNFEEALSISKEADDKFEIAFVLYSMGRVAQAQGDSVTARKLNLEAIVFFRERCAPSDIPEGVSHCLETFAILAVTHNQMDRATCLFSASETLYTPLRFEMSAKERAEHDEAIAVARATLGEEAFTAAWEAGQKMTLEQAVEYALQED
jgi:tetratricopeptide (TPR) repeat protein